MKLMIEAKSKQPIEFNGLTAYMDAGRDSDLLVINGPDDILIRVAACFGVEIGRIAVVDNLQSRVTIEAEEGGEMPRNVWGEAAGKICIEPDSGPLEIIIGEFEEQKDNRENHHPELPRGS